MLSGDDNWEKFSLNRIDAVLLDASHDYGTLPGARRRSHLSQQVAPWSCVLIPIDSMNTSAVNMADPHQRGALPPAGMVVSDISKIVQYLPGVPRLHLKHRIQQRTGRIQQDSTEAKISKCLQNRIC